MIQLRLTTNRGIEDVVEKELYDRASQMGGKNKTPSPHHCGQTLISITEFQDEDK